MQQALMTTEQSDAERIAALRESVPPAKLTKFFHALVSHGTKARAAQEAKLPTSLINELDAYDPEFHAQSIAALNDYADLLEAEATRRGMYGVLEDVYYKGQVVGQRRIYSDSLLTTLLQANRPDKFRRSLALTGANGGPIQAQIVTYQIPDNGRSEDYA